MDQTKTTKTTTGEVYKYTSDDSKTNFSVIYDAEKGTAAVKNEDQSLLKYSVQRPLQKIKLKKVQILASYLPACKQINNI